jgi:hypothetical protein
VAIQLNKMDIRRALQLQLKLQTVITEERIKYETKRHHEDIYRQYPSPWPKVISASGSHMATNQSVVPLPSTNSETQLLAVSSPASGSATVGKKGSFIIMKF